MANPVQTGGTIVSLAYNAEAIEAAITAEVSVIPILNVIIFALDILELAGIIPDPISLLIGAFTGRPREQASLEQAGRLMNARNPAARQAGIMLERMVNEWDIVTSESGSGRTILDAWAQLFVNNLTAQGVSLSRAREILVHATSEAAQTGLPLEPELQQPLAPQLVFNAEQSTLDYLTAQYKAAIGRGLTIDNALHFAEQQMWKNIGLRHLFKLQIGTYIPPNPPPQTVIPGQGGACPAGYTLDPTTEFCLLNQPGGQGGGGGGGGGNVGPDPDGDELTDTLCAQMNSCTQQLISALQGANPVSGPVDDTCCQNVVDALGNVVTALTSIASAAAGLASSGAPPVDLSGVAASLDSMAAALADLARSSGAAAPSIVEALNNIANKIPAASGTDVSGIVQKLQMLFDTIDVPMPVYQSLVDNGYIDTADLQLLAPGPFGAGLIVLLEKYGEKALLKLSHFLGIDWVNGVPELTPTATKIMDGITAVLAFILTGERDAVKLITDPILAKMNAALEPTGAPNLGNVFVDPDLVLADVATVTLNGMLIAMLVDALREGAGKPLEKFTELFGGLIGLEELREVQIGPKISYGIAAVAEMAAKARYQQSLPNAGSAADWRARGLISQNDATTLFRFNGYNADVQNWMETAAYSGLNARQMLRLSATGLFTQGDIVDELTFSGMRPASQKRFLLAAAYLATASERNQLNAALENAYVNGLLADADLANQLDQAQQNTDRDSLILARVQIQKRVALAHALETAYAKELAANVITPDQYRGLLQGIGLQDDWINTHVAVGEMNLLDIETRKAAAAALALERATASVERKAAMLNFRDGNIDIAALVPLLVGTGLTATEALAWGDLALLQKAGGLHWVYGQQLNASDAAALRARVTALADQRKRLQITDAAFLASLQALGIKQPFLNTIRATADAMISPKTAAVTIPVDTN